MAQDYAIVKAIEDTCGVCQKRGLGLIIHAPDTSHLMDDCDYIFLCKNCIETLYHGVKIRLDGGIP